jgi:hypothetical protein
MDNFGGIAILVLIWIVGAVFDKKKKEERRRRQMAQQSLPPSIEVESVSAEPRSQLPDASQREGSKLEQVLRQLNPELAALADQALAQSSQQTAAKPEPKVRSVTVRSPVDPIAASEDTGDFMAKAERAIARRRLAAQEYSRGRTAQDHATFHQDIRRPVAAAVESLPAEAPSLEQAIIWREILGPPRAMTIDEM